MGATAAGTLARLLIATAVLAAGSTAVAQDSIAGALSAASAGAINGHSAGGPDAVLPVHYRGGHGHPPPAVYSWPPRAPVYVVPPPAIVFLPDRGHGYWHHGVDPRGRPFRSWVPAARPRGYYAPAPRPHHHHHHHHHRGYRDGWRHGYRW